MNIFGRDLLSRLRRRPDRTPRRSPWQDRAVLGVERLDERIVPAVTVTHWTVGASGIWSNAANWDNGVPDATHAAELVGTSGVTITLDSLTTNMTIAGLTTHDPSGVFADFTGTLELAKGATLTVTSDATDTSNTGFKWTTNATIKNDHTTDSILLTGGGSTANNKFSAGTIGSGNKATLYVAGGTDFLISASASALGDDLVIGKDDQGTASGNNWVTFHNQTQTLAINGGANITVNGPVSSLDNWLVFDTDTTVPGMANQAISTAASSSYINNYDKVVRSGAGGISIDTPIYNNSGSELQLTAGLGVNKSNATTGNNSIDQQGGTTDLSGGVTLALAQGFLLNGGYLLTYGTATDTIDLIGGTMTMSGGTLQISADNTANYGQLTVQGSMTWSGGTYQTYVQTGGVGRDLLNVTSGLTTQAAATLRVNGASGIGSWWVVTYASQAGAKPTIIGAQYDNVPGGFAVKSS